MCMVPSPTNSWLDTQRYMTPYYESLVQEKLQKMDLRRDRTTSYAQKQKLPQGIVKAQVIIHLCRSVYFRSLQLGLKVTLQVFQPDCDILGGLQNHAV
jgi:hypothetical protein